MTITNNEAAPGGAMKAEIEDYSKALEVLKTYPTQDGLDVDTLLDSDKHGALTYNDFLILPGYIGKPPRFLLLAVPANGLKRLPRFRGDSGYSRYQAYLTEGPPSVISYGHCDRA